MSFKVIESTPEGRRPGVLEPHGLALRELAAQIMRLAAQGGEASRFNEALEKYLSLLREWPRDQPPPQTWELQSALGVDDGDKGWFDEHISDVCFYSMRRTASRYQKLIPQEGQNSRDVMNAAIAFYERREEQGRKPIEPVDWETIREGLDVASLTDTMRRALEFYECAESGEDLVQRPPLPQTVRALVERRMIVQADKSSAKFALTELGKKVLQSELRD